MNGERYYTTKIWQRPSSIGFSSAGALSTSMDPAGEPVISTWKRPCQKIQNGSEFPELVAQNFRNPQLLVATLNLTAWSVVFAFLYERSGWSLPVVILLHASYVAASGQRVSVNT